MDTLIHHSSANILESDENELDTSTIFVAFIYVWLLFFLIIQEILRKETESFGSRWVTINHSSLNSWLLFFLCVICNDVARYSLVSAASLKLKQSSRRKRCLPNWILQLVNCCKVLNYWSHYCLLNQLVETLA